MCKKTCNTAVQLQSALSQLAAVRRENDNQSAIIAAHQRDLADRDAEIASLKRARDHQAETITKYQDQGKHQIERIATLERSNQARWERIQEVERLADSRLEQLQAREAAHTSDHLELVARREECERQERTIIGLNNDVVNLREYAESQKADRDHWKDTAQKIQQRLHEKRDECDNETKARQRVQIELNKAQDIILNSSCAGSLHHAEQRLAERSGECRALGDELRKVRGALEGERGVSSRMAAEIDRLRAHSTMQAETLGGYLTEIESLKVALDKEIARVAELQEHGTDQYQEILSLRHDVAERAQREGRVAAMLSAAPECHCDDLQEQLANLHRSGKALIDSLDGSPMPYGLVAFIQSHTRAGDALEELAHE